jgi:hypothetical protein
MGAYEVGKKVFDEKNSNCEDGESCYFFRLIPIRPNARMTPKSRAHIDLIQEKDAEDLEWLSMRIVENEEKYTNLNISEIDVLRYLQPESEKVSLNYNDGSIAMYTYAELSDKEYTDLLLFVRRDLLRHRNRVKN